MKYFLIIALAFCTSMCAFAQKQVIDFTTLENAIYTKPIKMDNVIFYASQKKFIEVDDRVSSALSDKFSKRLKFKGKGDVSGCSIIVNVKKGSKVTIYANSANKNDGNRTMIVTSTTTSDVIVPDFIVSDGHSLCKATYHHKGGDGKVIFLSKDGCFNVYRIEID